MRLVIMGVLLLVALNQALNRKHINGLRKDLNRLEKEVYGDDADK